MPGRAPRRRPLRRLPSHGRGREDRLGKRPRRSLRPPRVCFVTPLPGADERALGTVAAFLARPRQRRGDPRGPRRTTKLSRTSAICRRRSRPRLATFLAGRDPGRLAEPSPAAACATPPGSPRAMRRCGSGFSSRTGTKCCARCHAGFDDELQGFRAAVANGDWLEVKARLERGQAWRNRFRPAP